LLGLVLVFSFACSQESDITAGDTGPAAPYEPRVFDDVNPENVEAVLVAAPGLPEFPDCTGEPRNVLVTLQTQEYEAEIAPGITYTFLSFEGAVPGPAIVVCLGDWVEVTLKNPSDSLHAHNVDFHAATGDLGGGGVSIVAPGEQTTFRFQAIKEGAFVYHCAIPPIPMHVTSGMYGSIIVLPKGGLPDVDKQFYLMEGDFYTEPSKDDPSKHVYSPTRISNENPSFVVTNGKVGALTGENPLKVNVGDKVRFFYGQANDESWIHIIGGHFDLVYGRGSFHPDSFREYGVETTVVAAGSATVAEYTFRYPGVYLLVNHKLIRATEKGQAVQIIVEGKADPNLMTVTAPPSPVEGVVARPTATPVASDSDETTSAPVATGDDTFVSLQDPSGSGEYIFDEADLTFGVGESVNFVLEAEGEFHTFTVEELGINVAVTAGSTQELSFTFDTAGTYELICVPHNALGMVGTITVQ
jgi:nitrite reductase (NO-forming)